MSIFGKIFKKKTKSQEDYYLASQWVLMGRKLKRHKLARVSMAILAILYLGALFGNFIAPYGLEEFDGLYRNSAPTKYAQDARVSNSMIADGCVIEGVVENSIIFRGVKIGKGAVIRNSIILQDTYVGSDVSLNCVITDKNVVINDGRVLSGHQTMPFFIGKGVRV